MGVSCASVATFLDAMTDPRISPIFKLMQLWAATALALHLKMDNSGTDTQEYDDNRDK